MGGYNAIAATISLMKEALSFGPFDRFVLLQGLDYPIKSNREITEFFAQHEQMEFIKAQNISLIDNIRERHKYTLFYYLDYPKLFPIRVLNKVNSMFLKSGKLPQCKNAYVKDRDGNKMMIHQGCAQFALTRSAVEHIVDFHEHNVEFRKYFRSVYAVDEAYFHTIIYNSPFIKNTQDGMAVHRPHLTDFENVTYFEYPVLVTVFTKKDDWEKLHNSGFLFFRKACSESKELLDYIDEIHAKEKLE